MKDIVNLFLLDMIRPPFITCQTAPSSHSSMLRYLAGLDLEGE